MSSQDPAAPRSAAPSRRAVSTTIAWSVPVVAAAVAAPFAAASTTFALEWVATPSTPVTVGAAVTPLQVRVVPTGGSVPAGTTVAVIVGSGLNATTATFPVDPSTGIATITGVTAATPGTSTVTVSAPGLTPAVLPISTDVSVVAAPSYNLAVTSVGAPTQTPTGTNAGSSAYANGASLTSTVVYANSAATVVPAGTVFTFAVDNTLFNAPTVATYPAGLSASDFTATTTTSGSTTTISLTLNQPFPANSTKSFTFASVAKDEDAGIAKYWGSTAFTATIAAPSGTTETSTADNSASSAAFYIDAGTVAIDATVSIGAPTSGATLSGTNQGLPNYNVTTGASTLIPITYTNNGPDTIAAGTAKLYFSYFDQYQSNVAISSAPTPGFGASVFTSPTVVAAPNVTNSGRTVSNKRMTYTVDAAIAPGASFTIVWTVRGYVKTKPGANGPMGPGGGGFGSPAINFFMQNASRITATGDTNAGNDFQSSPYYLINV